MDALVQRGSLERRSVRLNAEGALLRTEIEASLLKIPDHVRFDLGRKNFNRACVKSTLNLVQRLYAWEEARDDESPAVNHVLRVAHRIAVRYETKDPTLIMAAVLHDAVEDHPETLARVWGNRTGKDDHGEAVRLVKRHYGHAVGKLVDRVSKRKNGASVNSPDAKIRAYTTYIQGITHHPDPSALVVKIADVCDNVSKPRPMLSGGAYSMKKYFVILPILLRGLEQHKDTIRKHWGARVYAALKTDLEGAQTMASGYLLSAPVEEE